MINTGTAGEKVTAWKDDKEDQVKLSIAKMSEEDLLVRVTDAVEQIRRDGKPLTKMSIVRLLRTHSKALDRYSGVRKFVEQVVIHPPQNRSEGCVHELIDNVRIAIDSLQMRGMKISQQMVAKTARIDPTDIRHCVEAKTLIEQAVKEVPN